MLEHSLKNALIHKYFDNPLKTTIFLIIFVSVFEYKMLINRMYAKMQTMYLFF